MSDERAIQLAMLLKAIDDTERELAEARTAFKKRLEILHNELYQARWQILSGQMSLVPDPPRITEAEELQPAGD